MTDKHRHRTTRAPHGAIPNWALVVFATCAVLLTGFAHALV
jgi:hypothetical protein